MGVLKKNQIFFRVGFAFLNHANIFAPPKRNETHIKPDWKF